MMITCSMWSKPFYAYLGERGEVSEFELPYLCCHLLVDEGEILQENKERSYLVERRLLSQILLLKRKLLADFTE